MNQCTEYSLLLQVARHTSFSAMKSRGQPVEQAFATEEDDNGGTFYRKGEHAFFSCICFVIVNSYIYFYFLELLNFTLQSSCSWAMHVSFINCNCYTSRVRIIFMRLLSPFPLLSDNKYSSCH